ncbi:MAG: Holliday junction ATP-dependent DNA helicase RuvA [Candidatus Pacebacteria bacterium]|nr:Holliday junction ATP-dependent DNA helicase RuvA [Candidatus Paceibacterota bacterium]
MINYISGNILEKTDVWATVENQGIGFKVFLSLNDLNQIRLGGKVKLFCRFFMRNENPELYGFLDKEQLKVFEMLEKISGIGPKAAMLIAPLGTFEKLKKAVESQDYNYFKNIKGIGTKKIQKIILEISGEIKKIDVVPDEDEAVSALNNLGFPVSVARQILDKIDKNIDTEERIKQALKMLAK